MAQASPAHTSADATASQHDSHGTVGEDSTLGSQRDGAEGRLQGLPRLYGKVNDDRDLTISDRSPSSGRYKIIVRDSTKRHNWHIYGSGVDKETSVRGTGRESFRVRLRNGTYTVVCDPHARSMKFTINVG